MLYANRPISYVLEYTRSALLILVLILVALIFRSEPYHYVLGGQDEGIYVNMSKVFQEKGQVFHQDKVRTQIKDDLLLRQYDNGNIIEKISPMLASVGVEFKEPYNMIWNE